MVPMMSWSKKAIAAGTLVTLIIAILGFLVIAQQLLTFLAKSNDSQAEKLCHDTVALSAATAVNVDVAGKGIEAKPFPNVCKTIDKKISGDPETVKKQVADTMARCWWMFGEGKYEESVFDTLPTFTGSDNKCFICYTMLVEENSKFKTEDRGISSEEFVNYLATTDYHRYDGTYLNYFQFAGGPGMVRGLLTNEGIKPGRAYAIAYTAKASKCQWCEFFSTGGLGLSLAGGAAIFVVGTGGLVIPVVTIGAAIVSGASSIQLLREKFLLEMDIDSIAFIDMSDEVTWAAFSDQCTLETDIAGR
ncbi:MAG: hypothetical protein Q8R37_00980 [Nanoarchaeota archaeon]|nr:hypothetical protein [Nanoarchaeota archaeon]